MKYFDHSITTTACLGADEPGLLHASSLSQYDQIHLLKQIANSHGLVPLN